MEYVWWAVIATGAFGLGAWSARKVGPMNTICFIATIFSAYAGPLEDPLGLFRRVQGR